MPGIERTDSWQTQFSSARPYYLRAVEAGVTFNEFYDTMRDAGLGYRRTNMLADWRDVSGLWFGETQIQRLGENTPIPERLTSAPWSQQAADYNAYVQYEWQDPDGKWHTSMRVIQSDTLLSKGEYEGIARSLYAPDGDYADASARYFHLRGVTRKPE